MLPIRVHKFLEDLIKGSREVEVRYFSITTLTYICTGAFSGIKQRGCMLLPDKKLRNWNIYLFSSETGEFLGAR